jgi:hypothetical protein
MNNFWKIVGAVLIGGLWLVAIYDYVTHASAVNQGLEVASSGIDNFYSILEGNGAPITMPNVGISG